MATLDRLFQRFAIWVFMLNPKNREWLASIKPDIWRIDSEIQAILDKRPGSK